MTVKIPEPPVITEDGIDLPPVAPGTPLEQLMTLLEWARIRRFVIGGVRIDASGSITTSVRDLELAGEKDRDDPDPGVWAAHGHADE